MGVAAVFIRRPVATLLLALGLFLTGVVAFSVLPVAPLPRIDLPTVQVSAKLPGADPETMAATVAAPLERRLGEIAGVTELTSTSSQGSTSIAVQFDLARDIDGATRDVMAAINASAADLPADLPSPPTYRKMNPADAPIMILAVRSDTLPSGKLYDACDTILAQRISQVEGVAQVQVSGGEKPAVRVRVNPTALAGMGLGLEDVRGLLAAANADAPKGGLDGPRQAMSIGANDQLMAASDYRPLVLKSVHGDVVRLSAVASVTDGVENDRQAGWYNNDKAVLIIIQKQAGANVIDTVDRIRAVLPQLQAWMPAGSRVTLVNDRTLTIRDNVLDVELTLLVTSVLVVLVVLLCLGRVTPTVAASVTVPLSLAGTLAAMWLLDYSIDNISLMALTISVGFVVDDAIVMIENIARHVEKGEPPLTAALKGAREITFTVISISVSLAAVFLPLLFMGGVQGRLFREFAVTLTVAIAVSAVVSITVTPTLYGHLMARRRHHGIRGRWAHLGEWFLRHAQRGYEGGLAWVLRHQKTMLGVMLGTVVLTVYLYGVVPKGFLPQQDTGLLMGVAEARTDISFQAMVEHQRRVADLVLADPAVDGMVGFISAGGGPGGPSNGNQSRMFISLKPLDRRDVSADQLIARLRPKLAQVDGMSVFLVAVQDLMMGGRSTKSQFQFSMWSENLEELRHWAPRLAEALKGKPGLADVATDQDAATPQTDVVIDRDAAARLGVSVAAIDQVLQDAFAQRQVSTIYTQRNQYHVVLDLLPAFQQDASALDHVFVPSAAGQPVPLSAIAHFGASLAPLSVTHQGQFPSATLSFNLQPGATLGEVMPVLQQTAAEIGLPPSVHPDFAGNTKMMAEFMTAQLILIGAALLAIYIVLGVLYESTLHPLTIISTLPSAGIGALLALLFCRMELSLMSIIGIILLMGIVKKNGIMLVDFAIETQRRRGLSAERAIYMACRQRFRPITMTTLAAVLGAVPLAVGMGAGSELRQPLGVAIVGGLLVSQFLTLYTTPVVYLGLARLSRWAGRRSKAKRKVIVQEKAPVHG